MGSSTVRSSARRSKTPAAASPTPKSPSPSQSQSADSSDPEDGLEVDLDGGSTSDSDSAGSHGEGAVKRPLKRADPEEDSDDDSDAAELEPRPTTISRVKSRVQQAQTTTPTDAPQAPPQKPSQTSDAPTAQLSVQTDKSRTFSDLDLDQWLVNALSALEIRRPTGIQRQCIPEAISGRNIIGSSRTGSGKTVAFMAPILQSLAVDPSAIFALVLTPTRELAYQIYEQVVAIAAPTDFKTGLVTGGADMCAQAIALAKRPHIVVATPGRLADHIRSSGQDTVVGFKRCRFVVLDEADRLLEPGPGSMLTDLETCMEALSDPKDRQTLLFTATVTDPVRALREMPARAGKQPCFFCEIDTGSMTTPERLRQMYLQVPVNYREYYLHELVQTTGNVDRSAIIFCNRTDTATYIEYLFRLLGHKVTALHSGLAQSVRTSNLARFRAKVARILVATDVVARGLDIPDVQLVINYDVPRNPDDYIHRVGRTARAGRAGDSVTLVGQRDVGLLLAIEDRIGKKLVEFAEEGVNLDTRVTRDALKIVTEHKREAKLRIEEGKDVTGRRMRGHKKQKVV